MDFFNKTAAQVTDLFRSMTPGARILTGLMLALVAISLVWLVNHQGTGPDTWLMAGRPFAPSELPAMEAAFAKAGLGGYELEGNRIRIPQAQQAVYMAALADGSALPADFGDYLTKALEEGGPLQDRQQREETLKNAKQQELALIIRSMQGIENASVQYDKPRKMGFGSPEVPTASVSVKPLGRLPLDRAKVPTIRALVAGAIAGLSPDNVTVVDLNGGTYSGGQGNGQGAGSDHQYLATMEEFQRQYENQVQKALSYVPGATISVNVELDKELRRQSTQVKHDPKTVQVHLREESRTTTNDAPGAGGRPGAASQGPGANQGGALTSGASGAHNEDESSTREEQNLVSSETTAIDSIGMTPQRVTVAVGVPASYYARIWHDQNPTPTGQPPRTPDPADLAKITQEQSTNIRNHVGSLLPKPKDTIDPSPLVTVTTFHDSAQPELPTAGVTEEALSWFARYWSTLGMILLGLVSLLMLRSMVRSVPAESPPPAYVPPAAAAHEEEDADAPAPAAPGRPRRRLSKGPTPRDELVEMVREDPDAAANILKSWIGSQT